MRSRRARSHVQGWLGAVLFWVGGCSAPQRVTLPLMPPLISPPKPAVFWSESFETLDPQRWREVSVKGYTDYTIVALNGRRALCARAFEAASILLTPVSFDPADYPWLSWAWRVEVPVDGEALERKAGSDASARVYVYFDTGALPWQKPNLDYVWSTVLPRDTLLSSAYRAESKILVAEHDLGARGAWRVVRRNLVADYRRAFGEQPPDVAAIGLMVDTDNTRSHAIAYFDDVQISKLEDAAFP